MPCLDWSAVALRRLIETRRAVGLNGDLVGIILSHAADVRTYVAASRVCRLWHEVCVSDEVLLRLVALSQDALTRTVFRGLFALTSAEAAAYAHSTHCSRQGYTYHLYRAPAVEAVLKQGGIEAVRARRRKLPAWPQRYRPKAPLATPLACYYPARRPSGPWDAF
jgi:hypothetical protein